MNGSVEGSSTLASLGKVKAKPKINMKNKQKAEESHRLHLSGNAFDNEVLVMYALHCTAAG
jgi:hypothetical protein